MKPKALWICGRRWVVHWVPEQLFHDGRPCHAICDKHASAIHVSAQGDAFSSLWHEITHAIVETVTNGHPEDEESCVQAAEVGWLSIIRDPRNKWLKALILEA